MAWKNVLYENGKFKTGEGGGGGASALTDLSDVNISSASDGQVLKYDSASSKWVNANESGGGGTVTDVTVDGTSVVNQQGVAEITMPTPPSVPDELSDLSDVQFSNLTDHQPLRYNANSQKWENGADSYPPLIYSDEEREVGVWKNGKPLYQRTFTVTLNANERRNLDTNIEFCFLVGNSYITSNEVLSEQYIDSSVRIYCYVDTYLENGIWTMRIQNMFSSQLTYCVTVRYTKTTDTAGSGTWTTQGGYAHHYSTSEKVVGTWVDGKPIYEKSVSDFTLTSGINVIFNNLSVKKLISVSGELMDSTGIGYQIPYYFTDNSYCRIMADKTSIWSTAGIVAQTSSLFTSISCIVRYTKTTD